MSTPVATIPNLSTRQAMLGLAYLAYTGDLITTPNPEPTIYPILVKAIAAIPVIEKWNVVWGPQTYTTPGSLYQDYMMYVAQNSEDLTQFAVAIRGTNSISDLDWLMGDLDVLQMVAWPFANEGPNPNGPNISEATSIDLQALLGMSSLLYDGTTNTTAKSLTDYLYLKSTDKINLYVTGHSLGGCVAGTLGLYLKQNPSAWDASNNQSVLSCVTFAAPTAGDAAFAALSDKCFLGGPYPPNWDETLGTAFDAVRCPLDVAPLAWTGSNVYNPNYSTSDYNSASPLFALYALPASAPDGPEIDLTVFIEWTGGVIPYVLPQVYSALNPLGYTQTVSQAVELAGPELGVNPTYAYANRKAQDSWSLTLWDSLTMFVSQAVYQHSYSYPAILQVPQLVPDQQSTKSNLIVEDPDDLTATKKSKSTGKPLVLALANLLSNSKTLAPAAKEASQ